MEMTVRESAAWQGRLKTPVIFNQHKAVEVNQSTIERFDLNPIQSTRNAAQRRERVLLLTPLKDAEQFLARHFEHLAALTYPHELIDLAFLLSDTTDNTLVVLAKELERLQNSDQKFNSAVIFEKDFNFNLSQDPEFRHSFEAQGPRRKIMGKARNYLLYSALKPEHSWVYWRDVDIEQSEAKIIEDFAAHDKDIIVPSE
jgi:hypothetical protein